MSIDFSELEDKIKEIVLDGCEEYAYLILADAKTNCPVGQYPPKSGKRGGTMRSTGEVQRDDEEVVIGFGGPAAPYTERQHEDASLFHTVGTDHWLENAANAHSFGGGAELKGIIADRLESL